MAEYSRSQVLLSEIENNNCISIYKLGDNTTHLKKANICKMNDFILCQ